MSNNFLCQPCKPSGGEERDAAPCAAQIAASQNADDELARQKAAMLAEFEAAMSGQANRPAGERLMDAIMEDNLPEVHSIIASDPDSLQYSSLSSQAPLATAVQWGRPECCAALLEAKCDANALDSQGMSAVHHIVGESAQSGHPLLGGTLRTVETLVEHNADLSLPDAHGSTVLERVLEGDCLEAARCLMQAKADPNGPCKAGSLLNAACSLRQTRNVGILLEFKAALDVRSGSTQMAPLHLASRAGAADIVKMLLEAKADAGAENAQGKTALQLAEVNKCQACVELLLPVTAE